MGVTRGSDGWLRYSRRVLKSRRWQVLRQAILERDGWKCRECGEARGLEVDHVEPVRSAPKRAFDPSNLQALCRKCHSSKTRREVGLPPVHQSPAQTAWKQAVADLAAGNATA